MKFKFDWMLNHWSLLAINILIIVVIEASGVFFLRTGLVHLVAIIFVILGLLRLRHLPNTHDQFLQPVVRRGVIALIILAASHVVEYSSHRFGLPSQAIYANVINFYLTGLLFVTLGTEAFRKVFTETFKMGSKKESDIIILISRISILMFLSLTLLSFYNPMLVQLKPTSWHVYAYSFAALAISAIGIWRLAFLKRHVSIIVNFVNYFTAAFILIGLCALISALELVITSFGIPSVQIIYINHFLFYGALSLIILAYENLFHLGGVYDELEKLESQAEK